MVLGTDQVQVVVVLSIIFLISSGLCLLTNWCNAKKIQCVNGCENVQERDKKMGISIRIRKTVKGRNWIPDRLSAKSIMGASFNSQLQITVWSLSDTSAKQARNLFVPEQTRKKGSVASRCWFESSPSGNKPEKQLLKRVESWRDAKSWNVKSDKVQKVSPSFTFHSSVPFWTWHPTHWMWYSDIIQIGLRSHFLSGTFQLLSSRPEVSDT